MTTLTRAEYTKQTLAINARVYRVYLISSISSLALAGMQTVALDKWSSLSDPAVFILGLALAVLVMGLPLFLALRKANKDLSALRDQFREDMHAEHWLRYQKFIHAYKKGHTRDEDEV